MVDIEIEPEAIEITDGDTRLKLTGVLSSRHAVILVGLVLGILGRKEFAI